MILALRFSRYLRSTREWACLARCLASAFDGAVDFVAVGGDESSLSEEGFVVGMVMALVLVRVVRRDAADFRGGRDTTSGRLSTVVTVEDEERRVVEERDVAAVLVRADILGRACTSTAMLSGMRGVSWLA